jgi:hypothetical protein
MDRISYLLPVTADCKGKFGEYFPALSVREAGFLLYLRYIQEAAMPAVKTVRKTDSRTTKKAAKAAPKAAKKTGRREAVERGFEQLQKVQKELGEAHKETGKTVHELSFSHEETKKTLQEISLIHKETEKTLHELNLAHKETEKTLENAIKTLNNAIASTEKTLNDAIASTEKTLNKAIGGLSNTMGALVEHIMTAGLPKKFEHFGFSFGRVTTVKWADGENNIYTELDGLLENGDQAMAVEVKTTLRNEDVDDQLERMEKVRRYADLHGDKREFMGALAAAVVDKSSREYALKKGFFVIEPAGEDVKITGPVSVKVW